MGVVALHGLQLIERTKLLLTPVKHHPDVRYVTKVSIQDVHSQSEKIGSIMLPILQVRTFKMHLFTIIQLLCLALLGVIKFTKAALAFPFILLLLVPFRLFVLNHIFSESELHEVSLCFVSANASTLPLTWNSIQVSPSLALNCAITSLKCNFQLDNEESAAHSEGTPHQVSEASEGSIVEDKLPNSSADDEDQTEIYRPLTTPVM